MEALIIKPANKKEAHLLEDMIKKMKVKYAVIDSEDKEDYALARAMLAVKNNKKVSEESVLAKLKS